MYNHFYFVIFQPSQLCLRPQSYDLDYMRTIVFIFWAVSCLHMRLRKGREKTASPISTHLKITNSKHTVVSSFVAQTIWLGKAKTEFCKWNPSPIKVVLNFLQGEQNVCLARKEWDLVGRVSLIYYPKEKIRNLKCLAENGHCFLLSWA